MFNRKSLREIEIDAYRNCQLKILSLLDPPEGEKNLKLLDIGCGDGSFSLEVAKKCNAKEIHGLEINKDVLEKAKKKGIKIHEGDANKKFPFKDNFFDVIIANQVVEHLLNPDNFFEEIHRILKPNGYCIISTPNLCSLHNRIFILLGWQITNISPSTKVVFGNPNRGAQSNMWGPYRHLTIFSPPALKEMSEFYGLKVEKITGSGFHPFKSPMSNFLSTIFPKLSVFLLVKARKLK
ncbi:MAG: class I SAM-dependent methyltransferase [Candidatus Aenigmatarchaeota archaeon]